MTAVTCLSTLVVTTRARQVALVLPCQRPNTSVPVHQGALVTSANEVNNLSHLLHESRVIVDCLSVGKSVQSNYAILNLELCVIIIIITR